MIQKGSEEIKVASVTVAGGVCARQSADLDRCEAWE